MVGFGARICRWMTEMILNPKSSAGCYATHCLDGHTDGIRRSVSD